LITLAPLTERIKKINLTEDMGGGLINDPAAAARNRERIEQARQFEPPPVTRYYECGSGRFGPSKLKKMHYQRVPRSGYRKIAKDY
jgi:hypothetical protein